MSQIQLRALMHAARRLLAILVLLQALALSESPEKHALTFIQISDPHLFDAGKKRFDSEGVLLTPENKLLAEKLDTWAAWDWALSYVNQLQNSREGKINFVVFTGDFGLEKVTDLLPGSIDPNTKSRKAGNYHKDLGKEECWGIDDAAKKVATSFGSLMVPRIYLVRGNNDLDADEDPADAGRFDTFVERVADELNKLKASNPHLPDLVNLTSVSNSPHDSDESGYKIIGLDSSSFKNKPGKLPASTQPPSCPFGNKGKRDRDIYQIEELKRVYEQIWVKKPEQQALLFTHVPDLDDRNCIAPLKGEPNCSSIASWNLSYAARTQWTAIMHQEKGKEDSAPVAAVFAGHFHDSRRDTYDKPYKWTTSKNSSVQDRTYVVPPLAPKFQIADVTGQSRGFSLVHVHGNPAEIDWQLYWLNTLQPEGTKPSEEPRVQEHTTQIEMDCICWVLFTLGAFVALGILVSLLWARISRAKAVKLTAE